MGLLTDILHIWPWQGTYQWLRPYLKDIHKYLHERQLLIGRNRLCAYSALNLLRLPIGWIHQSFLLPSGQKAEVLHRLRLSLLLPALRTPTSGLARPRHTSWKVIAGAKFAFLFLENGIIHVNVVENRRQILMT